MTELTVQLPDELAIKAQAAGLLNSEAIEKLLREQLRKQAGQELHVMLNKIDALGIPPMSEEEIQAVSQLGSVSIRVRLDFTCLN